MAKLSIIIPTYNVEKYIRICLDSLVAQTSKDFIAYVINDGSPANEFEIANEYASKYDFIKSIKKENGGYGSVLNMAFSIIETPYVLVCDPDDYLVENAVEKLLGLIQSNDADMVCGAKNLIYSDNQEVIYDVSYNKKMVTLESEICYERNKDGFETLYFIDPSPHAKVYRTDHVRRIVFPEKVSFTDNLLFILSLNQAEKVIYTKEALAYYLIDRAGNSSTDVKPHVIDYWLKVQKEILLQSEAINSKHEVFYYRMFETFKFVFNMIDRVHAEPTVLKQKLESTYQILEPLQAYRNNVEKYYNQFSVVQGKERQNDLKLIQTLGNKQFFMKYAQRKLNRIVYGDSFMTRIRNAFVSIV